MPRNTDSGMSRKKQCICLLQIENFPSRYEIYKSLEKFLAERHFIAEYEAINKDNTIQLIFKDSIVPIEFSKSLQAKKNTLPFYDKIKTKISIDSENHEPFIKNSNNYRHIPTLNNKMRNNSQVYAYENTLSQSSDSKKEDHHIQEIKRIIAKPRELLLSNGHSYSLILPRGRSLRNSMPFIEKQKLEYLNCIEEKRKWLNEKGFNVNIQFGNSERKTEIPNYVQTTPPKYPVHLHQFREVNKGKWIGKDFTFKGDLIYLSN